MKLFLYTFIGLIVLSFTSCDFENKDELIKEELPNNLIPALGNKFYGKTLKVNSIVKFTSLFPARINDIYSQHISSQIYEGLLKFNPSDLSITPCIAESYSTDSTNSIYIFKIRDNVFFHDNKCFKNGKGRILTAKDIQYTFEFLCSNHKLNTAQILWRDYIKGGIEYYNKKNDQVLGITVVDNQTIKIELNEPFPGFINIIALNQTSIFPKEAIEYYGEKLDEQFAVGTGPYMLDNINENLLLKKNTNYWKIDTFGNRLPFISYIEVQFKNNKSNELVDFKNGNLDFVWGIPIEEIENIMGSLTDAKAGKNRKFKVQSINNLQVEYYGFSLTDTLFGNIDFRKALNYSIDRDYITNYVLNGSAIPAKNGIIPEMKEYPSELVNGYSFSPKLAIKHLKKAGLRSGVELPTITLNYNKTSQINEIVAKEIKQQIKNTLDITIKLKTIENNEFNEQIKNNELAFWRYGWIADYPDPANFIMQFHSKNMNIHNDNSSNYAKFKNEEFDNYFDRAMVEGNPIQRLKLLAQAEDVLIQDAAVIPLFYQTSIRLINPNIVNFPINELEFRDYSSAYFIKKKTIRMYNDSEQIQVE